MINQAVILAGGLGTRLGAITKNTPKPMLLVNNHPFLEFLVLHLKLHGIKKILFSTGYISEKILTFFGDGSTYGLEFQYVEEEELMGTGGALKYASSYLEDEFLLMNGDSLFDMNYSKLCSSLLDSPKSIVSMGLKFVDDTKRYGRVLLEGNIISGYIEKGTDSTPGLINSGVYAMKKDVLEFLPKGYSSLENDLFPKLAKLNLINGYEFNGYFIDIGLPS